MTNGGPNPGKANAHYGAQHDFALPALSERSYAEATRVIGPDQEIIYGGAPGVTLVIRDERALNYSEKGQTMRRTPLVSPFRTRSAMFSLGAIGLGATATRPVIVEGCVEAGATVVTLAATDADGAKAEHFATNGISGPRTSLVIAPAGSEYRFVVDDDWNGLQLVLRGAISERGWQIAADRLNVVPAQHAEWARVKNIIGSIFSIALIDPTFFLNTNVLLGAQENVEMLLDEAIQFSSGAFALGRGSQASFRIATRVDAYIKANLGRPVYNSEICKALGVSPRVLHDSISSVMKMPLQRYLKLQRLWGVRNALLVASPETLIKTIALDYGFWHLARFSTEYTNFFGESPSETKRKGRNGGTLDRRQA